MFVNLNVNVIWNRGLYILLTDDKGKGERWWENLTWSIAEGSFPWWNVETKIAKACTWFMLTLNWSCSILALSSHMLASISFRLETSTVLIYQYKKPENNTPAMRNPIRKFNLQFPAPLEELRTGCCCLCSGGSCCWKSFHFSFPSTFWHKHGIRQLSTTPKKIHQQAFTEQKEKLWHCSFTLAPKAFLCNTYWSKPK